MIAAATAIDDVALSSLLLVSIEGADDESGLVLVGSGVLISS